MATSKISGVAREFNQLQDDDVLWTPYYSQELTDKASRGLSSLCYRTFVYWLTRWRLCSTSSCCRTRHIVYCSSLVAARWSLLPPLWEYQPALTSMYDPYLTSMSSLFIHYIWLRLENLVAATPPEGPCVITPQRWSNVYYTCVFCFRVLLTCDVLLFSGWVLYLSSMIIVEYDTSIFHTTCEHTTTVWLCRTTTGYK
jgi:hypothetical protein